MTTTTTIATASTASIASIAVEQPADAAGPVDPALQRLSLQDAGWRTLSEASDSRRVGASDGVEVTIAHFPLFRALGVPTQMIRPGRHTAPDGAGFTEVYRCSGGTWIPVD